MTSNPNIVLITVDCLRRDHVGCYDYQDSTTPCLDQIAAEGTLFFQAVAQGPGTTFAFPAIMSSIYSSMLSDCHTMSATYPPIAEKLRRAGYSTAAFVSNPYLSALAGYDRGFMVFDECYSPSPTRGKLQRGINRVLTPLNMSLQCPPYPSAQHVTTRAGAWLTQASVPFFLWVHYMDAHWPYNMQNCTFTVPWDNSKHVLAPRFAHRLRTAPASVTPQEMAALKAAYDGGIRHIDRHIGQLLERIETRGLIDTTWIIITADHGEEFGEHGGFFHTRKLYDELIHVPLIIRPPWRIPPPRRILQQVRHLDIAPTLLDILGLPPEEMYEGVSLLPYLNRSADVALPAVSEVTTREHWILALRQDEWKLILHLQPTAIRNVLGVELYDLRTDPGEKENRASEEEKTMANLREQLLDVAATIRQQSDLETAPPSQADEEVMARLRALGYVG